MDTDYLLFHWLLKQTTSMISGDGVSDVDIILCMWLMYYVFMYLCMTTLCEVNCLIGTLKFYSTL